MDTIEVFERYLACIRKNGKAPDRDLYLAREDFMEIYAKDYSNQTGLLWIPSYRAEVNDIGDKRPKDMTLHEVLVCMTSLFARDRIYSTLDWAEHNGFMAELLERYLKLLD